MRRFGQPTKVDSFIKSSVADFNDPVFLTFHLDFFPVRTTFQNDGIYNDNLLIGPAMLFGTESNISADRFIEEPTNGPTNRLVEYSAYQWLTDYYGGYTVPATIGSNLTPSLCLANCITGLLDLQSSPWYFQSVQGISDLWKTTHRVKEGNKKATLTFNCLESIRQPLTDIAENYRYAVYDNDRLAYRLPDNLRWFDMEIWLIEIRDIVDHGTKGLFGGGTEDDFYQYDSSKNLVRGLKTIRFRLKQCEFDFAEFLGGTGQTEFKASTEDKPFSPSFKVNVGWVEQVAVPVSEANDVHKSGLLTGAFNALSNRLSNVLSSITRLPGAIAGSVLNDIQTGIEGTALGNVYEEGGLNGISGAINKFGASITGRQAPVGPPIADLTGTRALPKPEETPIVLGNLGDVYP